MTEIIPGIHQFKIPIANNPLGHTNIYLLQGEGGYVMIDAGIQSDEAVKAMRQQLAEAGVELSHISTLIITHGHGDHIGLAGYVREITGARIALHAIEIARLPFFNPSIRPSLMIFSGVEGFRISISRSATLINSKNSMVVASSIIHTHCTPSRSS